MLIAALTAFHDAAPDTPVLVSRGRAWFAAELLELSRKLVAALESRAEQNIALLMGESAALVALVAAASHCGKNLTILNGRATPAELTRLIERFNYELVVGEAAEAERLQTSVRGRFIDCESMLDGRLQRQPSADAPGHDGRLNILTSGTTGESKSITYAWGELASQVLVHASGKACVWLLAYNLNHFAGIQMLLHAVLNHATLVLAKSQEVSSMWATAAEAGVTHISSTPTFWRMVMAAREPALPTLKHVTLGGEIVTQEVLDHLFSGYQDITVSQVYASTELGSIVSVKDGRPGLPARLFSDSAQSSALFRVVDSELMVRRTEHGITRYLATGDLVTHSGDRVVFLGRKSEVINVGGVKVHPQTVEAAVSSLEGIAVALAAGDANPITGQIVRLDVVLRAGFRRDDVERHIREACMSLSRHARPRRIRYLDAIETTNLKLKRTAL